MGNRNSFTISLPSAADPLTTMRAVLDLDAHQRLIPLTTLHWSEPLRQGSRFTARTGIGPIAVDDTMQVTRYALPESGGSGTCNIRKTGRIIGGHIELSVAPEARGSRVTWRQQIGVRGVPALFDPVVRAVARLAYHSILVKLVAGATT